MKGKAFGSLVVLAFSLAACDVPSEPTAAPQPSESERLNAWFDAKFQEELDLSPLRKTFLGIKDEDYGGRGYSCRDSEGHVWNFGTYDPYADE